MEETHLDDPRVSRRPLARTSRLDVFSMMMSSVLASSVVAPSVVAPRARSAKRASVAVRASSEHKDATRREAMSLVAVRVFFVERRTRRVDMMDGWMDAQSRGSRGSRARGMNAREWGVREGDARASG